MPTLTDQLRGPIDALRRFSARSAEAEPERCELCARPLAAEHQHLLEVEKRQLVCACDACAILFSNGESGHYRRVPRRIVSLEEFQLDDLAWSALGIPIHLAFFFYSTRDRRMIALYPSPGGATEAAPAIAPWEALVEANPVLAELKPDVEALLVNRLGERRAYYIAPIDECYKLVGLIRAHWRGLSGGAAVWGQVGAFFDALAGRSVSGGGHG